MRIVHLPLLLWACGDRQATLPPEPSFLEISGTIIEDVQTDTGEAELTAGALAFSKEDRILRITGTALDRNADPYPYTGPVAVTMQPGKVRRVEGGKTQINSGDTDRGGVTIWYGEAVDGQIDLEVSVANGFGPTRVWVTATPEDDASGGSYATGVTGAFNIALPTIAQVQREDSHIGNEMEKEHVVFRTSDRQVVVTGTTTNGFWVTDIDNVADYGSMFVYSFSKPEGVSVGERVTLLSGGVSEHIGVTQLSWPSYETNHNQLLPVPDATFLDQATACSEETVSSSYALGGTYQTNDASLEAHEASLVTIKTAEIWSGFNMPDDPADLVQYSTEETYSKYGQWPIEIDGGCVFYVKTETTIPGFDPNIHRGKALGPITGFLSYAQSSRAWIVLVRGPEDFPTGAALVDQQPDQAPQIPSPHHFTPRTWDTQFDPQCAHHGTHLH